GKKDIPIQEIMMKDIVTCFPDDTLKTALQKLGEREVGRIPVVERNNVRHLVGLISRENIVTAYHGVLLREKET
ncbi:MAG: CBS domain-containing protein, partial [Nitrospirales bacterium]